MKSVLRNIANMLIVMPFKWLRNTAEYRAWKSGGGKYPVPISVKVRIANIYRKQFNLETLVVTGANNSNIISYLFYRFKRIYWHGPASTQRIISERFKGDSKLRLYTGARIAFLMERLPEIEKPALFFLDSIDASETIGKVLKSQVDHVIIVSDAHNFDGEVFPSIKDIYSIVREKRNSYIFQVECDLIRIYPK